MFTIKHVNAYGEEALFASAKFVRAKVNNSLGRVDEIEFDENHICDGTVYVMNENGKTVARYIIDDCRVAANAAVARGASEEVRGGVSLNSQATGRILA